MDRPPPGDGLVPLAGRCLGLLTRYALLLACQALLAVLESLLRLSRP